jgi:hypothetical protein
MHDKNGHGGEQTVIEVVGRFGDRQSFAQAVEALLRVGFARSDLSVLDSHESLSASEEPDEAWRETVAGLTGEAKYLGPITTAGLVLLVAGPIELAVAGAIAAGLAGAGIYEFLSEVRSTPHTREFARALKNGAVLLWVRAEEADRQRLAADILTRNGAADVHVHERPQG